ncbi:MAG: acetylornithine transaminase [Sutterellaceae bacterium]|nr:acetylornithine transaminase [Sutterellaceae bacterium]MDD7442023.1 acetylornithine transaminase [Sutterellaceae bacterium]MDY2867902.1 acetylornithine transaminase [Mesosutterella sp.]
MTDTKKLDHEYIANTYARYQVEIVDGNGSLLKGDDGRDYIDLGAGIGVNIFGQKDPEWIAAVTSQLNRFQHTSNLYYSAPDAELAALLCRRTGLKKVFFSNSGAEANECAIKVARSYAETKKGPDYFNIVTLKDSFHGRTLTTLAATGQAMFHKDFLPLTPGFLYADPDDLEGMKHLVEENKVAGILIECVQGEGGVRALSKDFVQGVADLCREKDIVFMTDEVQCGNGRTGKLYAYENYGVLPDVVTTAKGLGGGLPIGATLLGEKVKDVFTPGKNGSTFGGNPIVCAGALSIIRRIDDKLLAEVVRKGDFVRSYLSGKPGIEFVSGLGLMIGVKTVKNENEVVAGMMEYGVLPLTAHGGMVRLLPPLNIPDELLKKALDALLKAAA